MLRRTIFILIVFTIFGCKNKFDIDISKVNFETKVIRFDQELIYISRNNIDSISKTLDEKYDFFEIYNKYIASLGSYKNKNYYQKLELFRNYLNENKVFADARLVYNKFNEIEKGINSGFKHLLYYFPNKKIPKIYSIFSGFNESVIIDSNYLAFSVDKYLGEKNPNYNALRIPMYLRYRLQPNRIPYDCLYAYCFTEFPINQDQNNLLGNIIHNGKIAYLMRALFPKLPEHEIIGYTKEQYKWCKKNEEQMWSTIIKRKHFYTTSLKIINNYIGESPYTSGFPIESPPRAGIWIGYQIVKKFMNKHNKTTLKELILNNNDYQKILKKTGYNP